MWYLNRGLLYVLPKFVWEYSSHGITSSLLYQISCLNICVANYLLLKIFCMSKHMSSIIPITVCIINHWRANLSDIFARSNHGHASYHCYILSCLLLKYKNNCWRNQYCTNVPISSFIGLDIHVDNDFFLKVNCMLFKNKSIRHYRTQHPWPCKLTLPYYLWK